MFKNKLQLKAGDRFLLIIPLFLSIFGLLMIFDASSVSAIRDFNDKFYYVKRQFLWFLAGILGFSFFSFCDLKWLKKISFPFFIFSLISLIVVLIPGIGKEVYGGKRWIEIAGFNFQPSELTKLSFTLYLASLFEKKRNLVSFLVATGVVLMLLVLEPDLGTAIIFGAIAFGIYFVSGAKLKETAGILLTGFVSGLLLILVSPYRKNRLLTFFDSSFDVQGSSYHLRQILLALGSGGIIGKGLGQSRQKFLFLPEVTTDSIFAVVAEEFGFIGSILLTFILFFLIYKGLILSERVTDSFSQLLCVGITLFIGLQIVLNLGSMISLIPLTGIPLPFISYGGSSLMICLSGAGILYNVSKTKIK